MAESTLPHRDAVDAFVDRVDGADIPSVDRLFLFGSVARATHTPDSDIDVLAVLEDSADAERIEERLRDVAYDVMLERGTVFSIHAVTESTLRERDHPFFRTILEEGRLIYG